MQRQRPGRPPAQHAAALVTVVDRGVRRNAESVRQPGHARRIGDEFRHAHGRNRADELRIEQPEQAVRNQRQPGFRVRPHPGGKPCERLQQQINQRIGLRIGRQPELARHAGIPHGEAHRVLTQGTQFLPVQPGDVLKGVHQPSAAAPAENTRRRPVRPSHPH